MDGSPLIPVDEALALLDGAVAVLPAEVVATVDSLGRTLAEPAVAANQMPLFDSSAVDGYAVRAADLAGAPVTLPLGVTVAATGHDARPSIAPGEAARIFTGGLLPDGADTVVRQELTERPDDEHVVLQRELELGTDVRRAGEELAAGTPVAPAGAVVTPGLLGALAFVGVPEVRVRRRPRVQVFVTGDEVVPLGEPLRLGQIPDSNGPLVAATLASWGVDARVTALEDDRAAVERALDAALTDADVVITTGGVSVGDFDFIPSAAEAVGAERLFWKVAQKPGMPLYVAQRAGSILLGLPGNPGAVMVNLHVYVRHVLDRLAGRAPEPWPEALAVDGLPRDEVKTLWVRAAASLDDGTVRLRLLTGQASHMLANLAEANALIRVPPGGAAAGTPVTWTGLG